MPVMGKASLGNSLVRREGKDSVAESVCRLEGSDIQLISLSESDEDEDLIAEVEDRLTLKGSGGNAEDEDFITLTDSDGNTEVDEVEKVEDRLTLMDTDGNTEDEDLIALTDSDKDESADSSATEADSKSNQGGAIVTGVDYPEVEYEENGILLQPRRSLSLSQQDQSQTTIISSPVSYPDCSQVDFLRNFCLCTVEEAKMIRYRDISNF